MKLLFITQKMHEQDSFVVDWVQAFRREGYDVTVLCLEKRRDNVPFPVVSMGKELGYGKIKQVLTYWKHLHGLSYDRAFVHMSPIWGMLGAPFFITKKIPTYLWYTHYKMSISLKVTAMYVKRMFCATSQSLPQYNGSPKKIVTGHGIDLSLWPKRENKTTDSFKLIAVHRLSRSKRLELIIEALMFLPDHTLDVYGIEAEEDYVRELRALVTARNLSSRVTFHGTVPTTELPAIYTSHRLIMNMASETIDKTMIEAMTCGCYPVTTKANAQAIGLPLGVEEDTPSAIADFVQRYGNDAPLKGDAMYAIAKDRHSLDGLVRRMSEFIRKGC